MNSIIERVNAVCQDIRLCCNTPVTFKKLVAVTKTSFRKHEIDIHIRLSKENKNLGPDEFYVMAYYDHEEDADGGVPIEVIIHHNIASDNLFPAHAITEFLVQIYDATVHEFKHQRQSRKRKHVEYYVHPGTSDFRLYLKDPDEVDAYAFSIAIEILRFMPRHRALRYMTRISVMSKMSNGTGYMSPTLQSYVYNFKNCKLLVKLAKKIYKHLETIDTRHIFM